MFKIKSQPVVTGRAAYGRELTLHWRTPNKWAVDAPRLAPAIRITVCPYVGPGNTVGGYKVVFNPGPNHPFNMSRSEALDVANALGQASNIADRLEKRFAGKKLK